MSSYLKTGRLADVLALIQVLALDEHSHRSEVGLNDELEGPPRSAKTWEEVAEAHREFFRLAPSGTHRVSLVARHVTPDDTQGTAWLPADYTGNCLYWQSIFTTVRSADRNDGFCMCRRLQRSPRSSALSLLGSQPYSLINVISIKIKQSTIRWI